jgi:outer membrane lipoprotein-sorting protein
MKSNPSVKFRFRTDISKSALAASVFLLLAAFSGAMASTEPTAQDILKSSQKAYDALTSYSDNSAAISNITGERHEATYTTKLRRPNFYKIEWTGSSQSGPVNGVCRSDGTASLLTFGFANWPQVKPVSRAPDLQTNLGALVMEGIPVGVDLPEIFLGEGSNKQAPFVLFSDPRAKAKISRQADEKIDRTDCYVITVLQDLSGEPNSVRLSIGKQDFLIRQWREELGETANTAITVTHRDVSVNPHFSPEDFAH